MKTQKTFLSSKYHSMLIGGTVMAVLVSITFMSDMLIAGIVLGEDAAAGVSLVMPVYALASFLGMLFSLGVPILYSESLGAFQKEKADRIFGTGLVMAVVSGSLLFLGMSFGADPCLRCFGPEEPVLLLAEDYIYWMKYVVLFLPFNELIDGMVFADGDEVVSTVSNLVSGIGNVLLSLLLCRTIGMRGLGLATFVSMAASIGIHFLHFRKKGNSLRLNLTFSLPILKTSVQYGIVDAGSYLFTAAFTAVMNWYVIRAFDPGMLIIIAAVTLVKEAQMAFDGIGEAITPIIGVYLGEETYPGVREIWKLANRTALFESFLVTLIFEAGAPLFVSLLGIRTPGLTEASVWGIRVMAFSLVFTCRLYLDSSYYILAEKIPLGVMVCALRDVICPVPLAILGGTLGDVYGMLIGLALAPPISFALSWLYISCRYGKENYPLFLAEKGKNCSLLYEFTAEPDAIVHTRDEIGRILLENGCERRLINRTMLLFEELFMLIHDQNPGRPVLAECFVEASDTIRLITKDDGSPLNLLDIDQKVSSLRTYIVTNLVEHCTAHRVHLMTLSFNRNAFEITL